MKGYDSVLVTTKANDKIQLNINHDNLSSKNERLIEVHYLWCDKKFTFSNFLSVKSAFLLSSALTIHIHSYRSHPSSPDYLEWLSEVKKLVPFVKVHVHSKKLCSRDNSDVNWIFAKNNIFNGYTEGYHLFLHHNIIVYAEIMPDLFANQKSVLIYSSPNVLVNDLGNIRPIKCDIKFKTADIIRGCVDDCVARLSNNYCFNIEDDGPQPRNIMFAKNEIAEELRQIFYGFAGIALPLKHENAVIPKVGHYCWFNSANIDFSFYLSMLSLLYVVRVDCIVIHGNKEPMGQYWDDIRKRGCVKWQFFPLVNEVWGNKVKVLAHQADVARAEVFIRYGGLHIDPDVYFMRPLPEEFWHYEAVLALDAYGTAPMLEKMPRELGALVNLGVCMSMPGSRFFRLYQQSQWQYYDKIWLYNSGIQPFHIYERNPTLARLVPNMQLICNDKICYPGWAHNDTEFNLLSSKPECLFHHVYAVHIVHPTPAEFENPESIQSSNSKYGRLARFILEESKVKL